MKKTGYIVVSMILSLGLHAVLLLMADRIRFAQDPIQAMRRNRPTHVGMVDLRDRVMNRPTPQQVREQTAEQLREAVRNSERVREVFDRQDLDIPQPRPNVRLAGLGRNVLEPALPEPEMPRAATAPRPQVVEIDAIDVSRERLEVPRRLTRKLARVPLTGRSVPSLLDPGPLRGAVGRTFDVGMRMGSLPGTRGFSVADLPPEQQTGEEALRQEAIRTGMAPLAAPPGLPGITAGGAGTRMAIRGETIEEFEDFVNVSVTVWEDPNEGGYFRVDVAPNPQSDALRDIPKDLLFLIDCSASISSAKLEQFKRSVVETLQYLNPTDRFNVVSFRTEPEPLFDTYRPVSSENLTIAADWIRSLVRTGMTDVFNSLLPSVSNTDRELRATRPLNIFLLTDGRSTVPDKPDMREFVSGIAVEQDRNVNISIYTFSAGRNANLPLLDFLAYHNRGMSLHVEELRDFQSKLVGYFSTHSSLILMDLECHATAGIGEEIYPKRLLPHVYRGETLSLFGRYPLGTEELTLSIVGRHGANHLMDLVVRATIAECARGTARIAEDWAAQKVFHLLGQDILVPSEQTRAQIQRLADEYNLFIPY
jgi:hypothetical protein